jgi:hypothetical protein
VIDVARTVYVRSTSKTLQSYYPRPHALGRYRAAILVSSTGGEDTTHEHTMVTTFSDTSPPGGEGWGVGLCRSGLCSLSLSLSPRVVVVVRKSVPNHQDFHIHHHHHQCMHA